MKNTFGDTRTLEPVLSGAKYQQGYRASVIGILGEDTPRVSSRGNLFFNIDRWTSRKLVEYMCEWAKENPGCVPARMDVQGWITQVNNWKLEPEQREIVIAATPEVLPLRMALALTGGGYHEGFHTLFSHRRNLRAKDIYDIVVPRWAQVKDWSGLTGALLQWSNIVEDIRIERRGREQFEGTYVKLCDLQDYILYVEEQGENSVRAHGGKPGALSIIERAFRDVGLGYNTERQRLALDKYQTDNKKAFDLAVKGPLSDYLKDAITLSERDGLGCFRLALDIVAKLAQLGEDQRSKNQSPQGQAGDGKQSCPSCGAPGNKLVVRPKSKGQRDRGIVTCVMCGWQTEVEMKPADPNSQPSQQPSREDSPRMEGFDDKDGKGDKTDDKGKGGGKGDDKDDSKGDKKPGDGKGADGKDKDGKGAGGDKGEDKGDDKDGKGAGADGDEKGKEGEGGAGGKDDGKDKGKGDDKGDGDGQGSGDESDGSGKAGSEFDGKADQGGSGAGGFNYDPDPVNESNWVDVAKDALKDAGKDDIGVKDSSSALQGGFDEIKDKEENSLNRDEAPWRPYDQSLDQVCIVPPSVAGKDSDKDRANNILDSVKEQIAYLRSRMRTIIRSLEQTRTIHGVRKGRGLSGRFLVHSKASIKANTYPSRAYTRPGMRVDMTMAAAMVVDESGSMSSKLTTATRILMAITEPFDGLGCPTLVLGFRNGKYMKRKMPAKQDWSEHHRWNGIVYDIFKGWNEPFRAVKWRFANTRATGGTPMADGVEYALKALLERPETHRFMFVVTDGQAEASHVPVINRQLRIAKQEGIHIVGVGIGGGSTYVKTLFPDHVWASDLGGFPKALLAKMNELVDVRLGAAMRR
jgi:hypothetical protein